MVFENGVKNIQAAAYNGARTVFNNKIICDCGLELVSKSSQDTNSTAVTFHRSVRILGWETFLVTSETRRELSVLQTYFKAIFSKTKIVERFVL